MIFLYFVVYRLLFLILYFIWFISLWTDCLIIFLTYFNATFCLNSCICLSLYNLLGLWKIWYIISWLFIIFWLVDFPFACCRWITYNIHIIFLNFYLEPILRFIFVTKIFYTVINSVNNAVINRYSIVNWAYLTIFDVFWISIYKQEMNLGEENIFFVWFCNIHFRSVNFQLRRLY